MKYFSIVLISAMISTKCLAGCPNWKVEVTDLSTKEVKTYVALQGYTVALPVPKLKSTTCSIEVVKGDNPSTAYAALTCVSRKRGESFGTNTVEGCSHNRFGHGSLSIIDDAYSLRAKGYLIEFTTEN
jgi:hypothetical protein